MALAPGSRLGPYEILAPLGAGGMGTCAGRSRRISPTLDQVFPNSWHGQVHEKW
jgi:hypothetical protein